MRTISLIHNPSFGHSHVQPRTTGTRTITANAGRKCSGRHRPRRSSQYLWALSGLTMQRARSSRMVAVDGQEHVGGLSDAELVEDCSWVIAQSGVLLPLLQCLPQDVREEVRPWLVPRCCQETEYAVFYLMSAALLKLGIQSSAHEGLASLFGQHLVKPGLLPVHAGRDLATLLGRFVRISPIVDSQIAAT